MPEPIAFDNSYYRLPGSFYSSQSPTPVSSPSMIALNESLTEEIGIDQAFLSSDEGLAMLSGNTIVEGSQPIATVYAGYQFGHWNPVLQTLMPSQIRLQKPPLGQVLSGFLRGKNP